MGGVAFASCRGAAVRGVGGTPTPLSSWRGWGVAAALAVALAPASAQWIPTGALASVPVVRDCDQTAGDVMATRLEPPTIYLCPLVVAEVRRRQPGLEHFFLVHEYGHLAEHTVSEAAADCWAARALAGAPHGRRYLDAAIAFFRRRGSEPSATYGSPAARADRIRDCAETPAATD